MKFNADRIRNVLPKNIEEKKIEDYVVNALEFYNKHLQKQRNAFASPAAGPKRPGGGTDRQIMGIFFP